MEAKIWQDVMSAEKKRNPGKPGRWPADPTNKAKEQSSSRSPIVKQNKRTSLGKQLFQCFRNVFLSFHIDPNL
jgi:hypothetical protein